MRRIGPVLVLTLGLSALACGDPAAPDPAQEPVLLSIAPAAGAIGVDPTQPIVLEFNHPMGLGMEVYVDLHQGDINGPVVPMTAAWSEDRTTLTITPDQPLQPATTYTVHLGGNVVDREGRPLNYQSCQQLGGQRLQAGQMGQGSGHGHMGNGMGPGWRNPDGSYGMTFTFTTA